MAPVAEIAVCTATLLVDPMSAGEADIAAAGEAAVAAGFQEAAVWAHQIPGLAGSGLRIGAVEAASQWANGALKDAKVEAERLADLAAAHGAPKVLACCLDAGISNVDESRRNLAALADVVAAVGAQVCLEFLPWTGIPDLATAWTLVEPLGPETAILLDTWHWTRQPGGPAPDLLRTIPGNRIGYVQLCDAKPIADPDVMTEAMTGRLLPGKGVVDFASVFAVLDEIGAQPFVATEVFNPSLVQRLGAVEAARAMRAGAVKVLSA